MLIHNQKPNLLPYTITPKPDSDMDIDDYIKQAVIDPITQPLNPNIPVTIQDANGNDIDIKNLIYQCSKSTIDPIAETIMKEIFEKTLVYYNTNNTLTVQDILAVQAGISQKMSLPSHMMLYTEDQDIIPVSKMFLAGRTNYETLFATFAFYARLPIFGMYFRTETDFTNFKQSFEAYTQSMQQHLTADTIQSCDDFQQLTLAGLTESLILRNDDTDHCEEYSFARLLMAHMMTYCNNNSHDICGSMPFSLSELICPKIIVIVNIDNHAKAKPREIRDEWTLIRNCVMSPIARITNKQMSQLTAIARNLARMQANAAAVTQQHHNQNKYRSIITKLSTQEPKPIDIAKRLLVIFKKMKDVNRSQNAYKAIKNTFAKPNRRDPDDYNKQGKTMSVHYKPDLHIYLDTSGSISEQNYQDAIISLIKMAKKLDINLYFNSFSDYISPMSQLNLKGKNDKQIYKEFQNIKKATGGTNFMNVWQYIDATQKRRRELSVMITDFEWYPPNHYVHHPVNLYYAPVSQYDWPEILNNANDFLASMKHIDANCRNKILF